MSSFCKKGVKSPPAPFGSVETPLNKLAYGLCGYKRRSGRAPRSPLAEATPIKDRPAAVGKLSRRDEDDQAHVVGKTNAHDNRHPWRHSRLHQQWSRMPCAYSTTSPRKSPDYKHPAEVMKGVQSKTELRSAISLPAKAGITVKRS